MTDFPSGADVLERTSTHALLTQHLAQADILTWDGCHKIYIETHRPDSGELTRMRQSARRFDDSMLCGSPGALTLDLVAERAAGTTIEQLVGLIQHLYGLSCGMRFINVVEVDGHDTEFNDLLPQLQVWVHDSAEPLDMLEHCDEYGAPARVGPQQITELGQTEIDVALGQLMSWVEDHAAAGEPWLYAVLAADTRSVLVLQLQPWNQNRLVISHRRVDHLDEQGIEVGSRAEVPMTEFLLDEDFDTEQLRQALQAHLEVMD